MNTANGKLRPRTIRGKVALATFVVLALVLGAAAFIIDRYDYVAALSAVDSRLEAEAEALAALTKFDGRVANLEFSDEIISPFARPRCGNYFQLTTPHGLLERSGSLADGRLPEPDAAALDPSSWGGERRLSYSTVAGPHEPSLRLATLSVTRFPEERTDSPKPADRGEASIVIAVQVARSMGEVHGSWWRERVALIIGIGLALVLGTAGAFFVATRATRPIYALTREAQSIARGGDQSRLDSTAVEGELREMVVILNQGFDRLAAVAARESRFAADVAHELKTPVAVCKSRLELAILRKRSADEYEDLVRAALQGVDRIDELISALLVLGRAESARTPDAVIDLRGVIAEAEECSLPPWNRGDGEVRVMLPDAPVAVLGRRELLVRMVSNLVDNARKHGASAKGTTVALAVEGGWAEIVVRDYGPGLPPELIPHVFERFARGDPSRNRDTGGSGLGLAIVKAIAEKHQGEVTIANAPDGGVSTRVRLPVFPGERPSD